MSTLAIQYYIKAKDSYPYDLPEAIESLEYAMSYDEKHAGILCLMGRFQFEQLMDFREAFYYFEQALVHNVDHIETYYHFSSALIQYGEFEKAKKLLKHAETVKGICLSCILERKALIHERTGNFCKAEKHLKKAIKLSVYCNEISNLKDDLTRVKNKNK